VLERTTSAQEAIRETAIGVMGPEGGSMLLNAFLVRVVFSRSVADCLVFPEFPVPMVAIGLS
jgi:hypothetical protein